MPVYFFWGDDDFRLMQAVATLREQSLDPAWASFNYDKLASDQPDALMQALNQAVTPPFGMGQRFVWLPDTSLAQRCSEDLLKELERTLPVIPESSVLLLTSPTKPDGRLKSTKLLQKHSEIREFSTIPPWKTEQLQKHIIQAAGEKGLTLTATAVDLLVDAVGSNTRQLMVELDKLALYQEDHTQPIDADTVSALVTVTTQNSLQLAIALREGNTAKALNLLADLIQQNEAPLRIVAVLVNQFRTWLWVKLMTEQGIRDERAIAQAAEVNNPKRIFFLQKEVRGLSLNPLKKVLPLLLELEFSLKQGSDDIATLQTKIIEISQLFQ